MTAELNSVQIEEVSEIVTVISKANGELGLLFLLRSPDKNLEGSKWNMPSGHIEHGETAKEAAAREFKEETGIDIDIGKLVELGSFLSDTIIKKDGTAVKLRVCVFAADMHDKGIDDVRISNEHVKKAVFTLKSIDMHEAARGGIPFTCPDAMIIKLYGEKIEGIIDSIRLKQKIR